MSYASLNLDSLTTGYASGGRTSVVTDGFTAAAAAGTFTCILGTNGAGKSTLLRTIAGLQPAAGGSVTIGGRGVAEFSPRELAQTVGVVLTDRQVFATQATVSELVSMGRIPHTGTFGTLSASDRAIVAEAMHTVGIAPFAARRVSAMSDGERQKAMIAKALAQQTPVILLDEPTAFLDFPSETAMFALMRRLAHDEGKTVIAATHSIAAALQSADALWLLHRGETPLAGTPRQLADAGALNAFFDGAGVTFEGGRISFHIESHDKHDSMYR